MRPTEYKRSRLSRNRRTVNRAYGGVLSALAVRERFVSWSYRFVLRNLRVFKLSGVCVLGSFHRIVRAFLVEEQKIVKKVLKLQKAKEKVATKAWAFYVFDFSLERIHLFLLCLWQYELHTPSVFYILVWWTLVSALCDRWIELEHHTV